MKKMYQPKNGSLLPSLEKKMGRYAALSSFAACFLAASVFTSCQDDYDDTALWDTVNDLEQRLAALEEWQNEVNHNIQSLYELINTTDYITSVTPYLEGGKEVGYTITFLHSDPIVIYHGEKGDKGEDGQAGQDGQNGYTPQIGLTKGEDGNWYWTLDGELMTDSQGNPIRANGLDGQDGEDGEDGQPGAEGKPGQDGKPGTDGEDGEDGEDGAPAPVPQISLGSTLTGGTYYGLDGREQSRPDSTAWYLSVDNGTTWYRINGEDGDDGNRGPQGPTGPTGPKGDSFFESVDYTSNDDYVIFTLANNGGTFQVAKYKDSLTFSLGGTALTDLTQTIDLVDGALTYTPATAEVSARILDGEGWSASAEDGTITVSPGGIGEDAKATLEVALLDNGRVIETYRLTVKQTRLQGEGTAAAPYLVSSPAELIYVAEQVKNSSNSYYQKVIQLTQDIDLGGTELTIGIYKDNEQKHFYGTLDGNGHSIKGLKINEDNQSKVGLFPNLASYATVKNLTLEDSEIRVTGTGVTSIGVLTGYNSGTIENCNVVNPIIEVEANRVGALAGYSTGEGEITNCHVVNANITGTAEVGGLVGYLYKGEIINCSAAGTITATSNQVGGIAGKIAQGTESTITACRFDGTLKAGSVSGKAGGIVGVISTCTATITACYASGTFSNGTASSTGGGDLGGIVGRSMNDANVTLNACYANNVTLINNTTNASHTRGGIIGTNSATLTLKSCYWASESATEGVGKTSSGKTTNGTPAKVDGATTTWETALSDMNTALSDTGWRYEASSDETFPLVIKATE